MILDTFKTHTLIFQIQYPVAYELWDRAGQVARKLSKIWPGLALREGTPQQQTLAGNGAVIQTGLEKSTVTLSGGNVFDQQKLSLLKDTVEIWRDVLEIQELTRASTRVIYVKEFTSFKEANAYLLSLRVAIWPDTKVFDQPTDSDKNGIEISHRFEDENSFAVVRIKAEQITAEVDLDPMLFDEARIKSIKNRVSIDFDRGILGSVPAQKFRADDWLKGFQHLLRRDLEKVLKGAA